MFAFWEKIVVSLLWNQKVRCRNHKSPLTSFHTSTQRPRLCLQFRNTLVLIRWVVGSLTIPKTEDRFCLSLCDCLFNIYGHSPHLDIVFSINDWRTCHAVVTRLPLLCYRKTVGWWHANSAFISPRFQQPVSWLYVHHTVIGLSSGTVIDRYPCDFPLLPSS